MSVLFGSLVRPVWRTLPRRALATAGGLGLLLAGSTRLPDRAPDEELGLLVLRFVALAGALGLAFLLDDPARNTSAVTPVGRSARTTLRVALTAPLAALWWLTVVLLLPPATRPQPGQPTLEFAAMAAGALALATVAVRFTDSAEVGKGSALWLGTAALLAVLTPNRWGLLATPTDPWWQETHLRWAAVLAVTLTVCATWTREPLQRRPRKLGPSGT